MSKSEQEVKARAAEFYCTVTGIMYDDGPLYIIKEYRQVHGGRDFNGSVVRTVHVKNPDRIPDTIRQIHEEREKMIRTMAVYEGLVL